MSQWTTEQIERITRVRAQSGLGTCCAEAQADGVPCRALGRDCFECDRAWANVWQGAEPVEIPHVIVTRVAI